MFWSQFLPPPRQVVTSPDPLVALIPSLAFPTFSESLGSGSSLGPPAGLRSMGPLFGGEGGPARELYCPARPPLSLPHRPTAVATARAYTRNPTQPETTVPSHPVRLPEGKMPRNAAQVCSTWRSGTPRPCVMFPTSFVVERSENDRS